MTFEKFIDTYKVGHSYGYEGTYVGECVSLVKLFIRDVLGGKPQRIGNAKDYWLMRNSDYIQSLFIPIANTPEFVPQRGDVFVRTSGKYGHIGIVITATVKEFYTIEQNYNGCRVVKHITHTSWKDINFLRPKNQKNIKTPFGVDLSKHNGKVNFKKLKEAVDFAILKIAGRGYGAEGTLITDPKFEYNYKWATKRGIPIGLYFYTQAITKKEAKAEAKYVLRLLNGRKLNLPIYYDVEYASKDGKPVGRLYNAKLSKEKQTAITRAFCKTIKKAGYRTGVYASTSFFINKMNVDDLKGCVDSFWVADYRGSNPQKYFNNITVDMWQNSSTGKVNGVNGNVDTDYMYINLIK